MSLSFEYGFTLDQWTNGTPHLDELRVTQLLESDLNMVLQIVFLGRRLFHRAEDQKTIYSLQWRSRPNSSSTHAILMKRLTYGGIRILKKVAIKFNNDGKAAFDQMVEWA